MINRDEANQLLDQLAKRFDIPYLELNDVDTAVVAFGEAHDLIIEFVEKDGQFVYWCVVGSLAGVMHDSEQFELARYLLNRNFPSKSLDGAYLATDSELDVVLLAKRIDVLPSEAENFIRSAQIFAEQVLHVASDIEDTINSIGRSESSGEEALRGGSDDNTYIKI